MQEKRLATRLLSHWNKTRKAEQYPGINKFNTVPIEDIWTHCFRVSVVGRAKVPTYKYEYMGEGVAQVYGRDLTGMIVDHSTRQFPGKVIHGRFSEILRDKLPLQDEGHFTNDSGEIIKYRACLLPFGNAKRGVTDIVVGLTCRHFR